MPLHCNKATVFFFLKAFYKTIFLAFILFLAARHNSQAQTLSVKADLTFLTSNYTQCDSLLIQVQVATDQNFLKLVEQSSWMACQPKTNFTYSVYLPLLQGSFYWRGRHQDECTGEISAWSSPFRFYLLVDSTKVVGGDANGDGLVSLLDLIYLVEYFSGRDLRLPLHRPEMSTAMAAAP